MIEQIPDMPNSFEMASSILRSAQCDLLPNPSEMELAMFACGWMSPDKAGEIAESLTASPALRTRLLELKNHLAFAEKSPEAQAQVIESQPVIKAVLSQALKASFSAFADWDKACSDTFQGQNESPVVWGSLKNLWASLQLNRSKSVRVAATRSGRDVPHSPLRSKVIVFPGLETADLFVERAADDSLFAHARFGRTYQHPREICLYMQEDEGSWVRLGGGLTFGTEWQCKVSGISQILDLPLGPLESHYFALTEGRWSGEKRTVLLRMSESYAKPNYSRYVRLQLRGAPHVKNGEFKMSIVLPENIRQEFFEGRLDAGIELSPAMYIVLGAWKVNELGEGTDIELSCRMPMDGIPDCELDYHAGLRLSLSKA